MQTLLFAPAAYNLAETTRTLEIAKACRRQFNILFSSYGGEFEHLITEAGFTIHHLEPQVTPEKVQFLINLDQGKAVGYLFSKAEVEEQVRNEIALYEEVQPTAVITGFTFSNNISCRVAGVPLIWLTQSTWNFNTIYNQGIGSPPDMVYHPPLTWLSDKTLMKVAAKSAALMMFSFRPFNQVAKQYGLPSFADVEKMWEGDYNLLPEPREFCPIDLPDSYHFIGPLIGRLDTPIPDEVLNLPHDKPIVYFAMGSSGQPEIIAKIVEGFAGKPYRVIAPVKSHLAKAENVTIPENVIVTDWLPAHKVNPMADISVIHGGIGTTMTACLAGKPIVGIGMMLEQEANIDCLVRLGFAIRIRKKELTSERLCNAIDKLLADKEAQAKAAEFQKITEQWDDPSLITQFFIDTYLEVEKDDA